MENSGNTSEKLVVSFSDVNLKDLAMVGGKNASLGELIQSLSESDVKVPEGFALTSYAYWDFIYFNNLKSALTEILSKLDRKDFRNIEIISDTAKKLILTSKLPEETKMQIEKEYYRMQQKYGGDTDVAVRSSATAEDLPGASFAGQHDSFLNIRGSHSLLNAVLNCYASLFNQRAIKYREDKGFDHMKIAISVGIQKMIRSDLGCSGVCFTLEPDSGFRDVIHIAGSWGLGENIVKGSVNPDEFLIFKRTLAENKEAIISRKLGSKEKMLVYPDNIDHQQGLATVNIDTPENLRNKYILSDKEILKLAQAAQAIEEHYKQPMDIEWAKDGLTEEMYIVQARPETIHSQKSLTQHKIYTLKDKGELIVRGIAIGSKIVSGTARILLSPTEADQLLPGEILITDITNPDWNVIMKKAGAIVTNSGGRTSHASIVARELGLPAVVGTGNATDSIKSGDIITVCCAEGQTGSVYKGKLNWIETNFDLQKLSMPKTKAMLILSDPDNAFENSFYPNNGVGLLRMEFSITNSVRIHPMALVNFEKLKDKKAKREIEKITAGYGSKEKFLTDKLSESIAVIAAAFYPKEVIVRMSDFKTNEYANLIGGKEFEPVEENPMIGFRGASRYYHESYREGFRLECEAMKKVREEMGLTNVKLMIPFCRTVEEARKVIQVMSDFGLTRGQNDLQIYMMVEIPSNALLLEEFSAHFDGFSIGSNDLTQLTLGIDRDSSIISNLFDERNEAPKNLIRLAISKAKLMNKKIGLCGQAPSDYKEYASFLVEQGIDSISFNPDAILQGIENILIAENEINKKSSSKEVRY